MKVNAEYKIYVACLASYNNGLLHGRWVDVTQGVDYIRDEVEAMLKESPIDDAEEWAIHEYDLGGVRIGENEDLERVADIGKLLSEGTYPAPVIAHIIGENEGAEIDRIVDILEESYIGEYEDLGDYARHYCEDGYHIQAVPYWLSSYIDYDAMGREWDYSGDIRGIENGHKSVYVLRRY